MTGRSANNLTEVVERAARSTYEVQLAFLVSKGLEVEQAKQMGLDKLPTWDEMDAHAKYQYKNGMLTTFMAVLNAADEVDGEVVESRKARRVPLEAKFEPGHGRPDLDLLFQVVQNIDSGLWDLEEARNTVAGYLNDKGSQ